MIAGVGICMIGVAVPRDIVSQLTEPTLNVAFAYAENSFAAASRSFVPSGAPRREVESRRGHLVQASLLRRRFVISSRRRRLRWSGPCHSRLCACLAFRGSARLRILALPDSIGLTQQ